MILLPTLCSRLVTQEGPPPLTLTLVSCRVTCRCVKSMCEIIVCAKLCSVLSASGFVFLLSIAIVLQKQPIYIKGVSDPTKASAACYEGAFAYFITMSLSIGYWFYYDFQNRKGLYGKESILSTTSKVANYNSLNNFEES